MNMTIVKVSEPDSGETMNFAFGDLAFAKLQKEWQELLMFLPFSGFYQFDSDDKTKCRDFIGFIYQMHEERACVYIDLKWLFDDSQIA